MLPRATINLDQYCITMKYLKQWIRRVRPTQTTFLLQHDKAWLHTSAKTRVHLASLGFEVLIHPSYSPELVPSDFFVTIFEERAEKNSIYLRWCYENINIDVATQIIIWILWEEHQETDFTLAALYRYKLWLYWNMNESWSKFIKTLHCSFIFSGF